MTRVQSTVALPDGTVVPRLGLGTWRMGERAAQRAAELAALKLGLDLGVRLIDTAEMYGDGGAEEVVREAVAGRRDDVFIVSKVYPHNASRQGTVAACERSLRRLGTDRIDLYLLHWPGEHPLEDTVAAFEALRAAGKIRHWGVSNFDVAEMEGLLQAGGTRCATNQILYNLGRREPEWALLDWQRERRMPVMAYSPLDQAALLKTRALAPIARKHGCSNAQVALAWLLAMPEVISIPKSSRPEHVREIVASLDLKLDDDDRRALDAAFPPPPRASAIGVY